MTTLALCVLGFLFLVVLSWVGQGRRSRRTRWPGVGVRITRGPLNHGPQGANPWGRPWGPGPWM